MIKPYTAAVLAGGRAQRMGGVDKGLVNWQGRPLVSHVRDALGEPAAYLVSANRNHERYRELGWQVVADPQVEGVEPFAGPLLGLLALMRVTTTPWLLLSPCDTPALPSDYAARMQGHGEHMVCARDAERIHPLHLWLPTTLADSLEVYLRAGERRVMAWVLAQQPHWVDFADCPGSLANINTLPT
ncbi:molybdenum cofactor guanylyltransferase MobA [Atopomonas sediminilitoris]|uniref:molybdenum cofactor guanylyltransferase MobA n=1 Tax=Atopomonas sediminilitoris TaxID=2919919 RepID=UPI001F4E275D|nr:molybdenum cofactor guanylyltransferase MobA [Atopomonas sediminilitoris]MCJ8170748.1 molybdenum cofactor guanylyltransferase [Atopomonas sediminilitoris]